MRGARSRKFFSYYKPYRGLLIADLACAFVVSATTLILPLCINYITRIVSERTTPDVLPQVYLMGGVMLLIVVVQTACNAFVDYQGHSMGALMEGDMRVELFGHYQKLSFGFYDEQRTGQLMSRITHDLLSLSELYHHGPEDLAIAILKSIGVFVILFAIDVQLAFAVLVFAPVMTVYAFYFNRKMNIALRKTSERIGDVNAQVEETLGGIRVVKSFTNEHVEAAKFARANARFVAARREGYGSETYFDSGMKALTQLMTIGVVVLGCVSIFRAQLDLPDLITFIFCIGILVEPIQRFVNFARLYQEGLTGFNRFMEIMEIEPSIQDRVGAVALDDVEGNIRFRDVCFRYREDYDYVLRDISLDVRAGEYVALVGPSGVGKTTLCSLIPRFYDVDDGAILLDGVDIRDVTLSSLRGNIGVVQQDVYLFAGSVADNIRYGKPDATREEIVEAAILAHAHEFIMALPQGYDTDIGQRGVKLSGGQKQRLSIARVFLKNPPIVIFDEATSALDNESEKAVQESLETLTDNRTTIVIAHRLSTVQNAERIVVLTEDGIGEQGTHDELLALDGTYAQLYNMQLKI
jgi:ATP-binding cassette, subfamily B, bacterial